MQASQRVGPRAPRRDAVTQARRGATVAAGPTTPQRTLLPLQMPTPVHVRTKAYTTIPYSVRKKGRVTVYTPEQSIRDRHQAYELMIREQRPLSVRTAKQTPIGNYVLVEQSTGRFHLEVLPGMPDRAIRRLVGLLVVHAKTRPDAFLNMLIGKNERRIKLLRALSKKELYALVKRASDSGGGTFIVVSEKSGGALGKAFWRHPLITKALVAAH